jgi:hypothetical protein
LLSGERKSQFTTEGVMQYYDPHDLRTLMRKLARIAGAAAKSAAGPL